MPSLRGLVGNLHQDSFGEAYTDVVKARPRCRKAISYTDESLWFRSDRASDNFFIVDGRLFGFVFVGKDQAEILGAFDREEQSHLATWRIDIPSILVRDIPNRLGFHEESCHNSYGKAPFFASRGVSHGMGACLMTDRDAFYPRGRYALHHYGDKPADGKFRIGFKTFSRFDDGCD